MKNFLISLKNRQPEATTATTQVASVVDNTPTKSNVVPTPEKAIPTPEVKVAPEPTPTPIVEVPTIKVTPKMAFGKPSVP